MKDNDSLTTAPVQAGDSRQALPEFGRTADVQRLFGIKRGSLYNLLRDGKVRSVLQRVRGQRSGVRLFYLPGIREMLLAEMEAQSPRAAAGEFATHPAGVSEQA